LISNKRFHQIESFPRISGHLLLTRGGGKNPRYNQPRKTWQYTKDFKITAVKLSYQAGIQVKQVAEGLDIHPFMLTRWRQEYREGRLKPCTSATTKAPPRTGDRQGRRKVE